MCASTSHGSATCEAGNCGLRCNAGYHACTTGCCRDLEAVAVGNQSSCVIDLDGALRCWGRAANFSLVPIITQGFSSGIAAVALGDDGADCVMTTAGAVRCWGTNGSGQLGDGTTTARTNAVPVTGLSSGVTAITAGRAFACAITESGVRCWGENGDRQLGDGTTTDRHVPTPVLGLPADIIAIAAASTSTCALRANGRVLCWGSAFVTEQQGAGPFEVPQLINAVTIAGSGESFCAVTVLGTATCWGSNNRGQLGDGTTNRPVGLTPVAVTAITNVTKIAVGSLFACATTSAGALHCWGDGSLGSLGTGNTANSSVPQQVFPAGISDIAAAGGASHACALIAGNVTCWGWNNAGQVGDGTTTERDSPVAVPGL